MRLTRLAHAATKSRTPGRVWLNLEALNNHIPLDYLTSKNRRFHNISHRLPRVGKPPLGNPLGPPGDGLVIIVNYLQAVR